MDRPVYTSRDFEPDDALLMPLREIERQTWKGFDLVEMLSARQGHPGRTILADGIPLASYGIVFYWPSLAVMWAFVSSDARRHAFTLYRALRKEWALMLDTYKELERIETLTLSGDVAGERLVKHLGFSFSAHKERYGPQLASYNEWFWLR